MEPLGVEQIGSGAAQRWRRGFIILLLVTVISNLLWLMFYFQWQRGESVIEEPALPVEVEEQTNKVFSDTLQLVEPVEIKLVAGTDFRIEWLYEARVEHWGNELIICLVGLDELDTTLAAKEEWNEPLCTYRDGSLDGAYLIARTRLSDGAYEWQVPEDLTARMETVPNKYKLRLLVFDTLPGEGRTNWEGNVAWDESEHSLTYNHGE
jgi:hypothetical protein